MDKDSPKKNSTGIIIGIIVVAVIVGLIALIGSNASNSGDSTTTGTQAGDVAASPCSNFANSSATSSISYAELIKDPTAYNGTNVVYTGQVVQILQNPDGTGVIRLAVTKEDYGWDPSSIIYVTYSGGTNAVDDDVVKIYGQLTGAETYTSEANYQITIPAMTACTIDDETQTPAAATPSAPAASAPTQTQPSAPVVQPVATQPTPAPQAPAAPKTWHTVTTITAATTENTPPFTVQGSEWRATWSCEPGSSGDVPPSVFAQATDGDGGDAVATPSSCPSNNVTYFYDGPATDYLQITSLEGDSVTVTIEDYY